MLEAHVWATASMCVCRETDRKELLEILNLG